MGRYRWIELLLLYQGSYEETTALHVGSGGQYFDGP